MPDSVLTQPVTDKSDQPPDRLGLQVPKLTVAATDNFDISFEVLQGFQTLLFFYPQNGLPGITQLAQDIATHYHAFKQIKTCIFGVSPESIKANQHFKDSLQLPFQLISDQESELAQWFNTLTKRTLFGDPIQTLEQSTFLIDTQGKVVKAWRNPEIRGHVVEVLEAAHRLAEGLLDEPPALNLGQGQAQLAADLAEMLEV